MFEYYSGCAEELKQQLQAAKEQQVANRTTAANTAEGGKGCGLKRFFPVCFHA